MQDRVYEIQMALWKESYNRWVSQELFSFGWFFIVVFLIVFYAVWILIVDKRRLKKLLLYGSLIAIAIGFIDIVAVSAGIWEYKIRLLPLNPATFPFDYTVVPILYITVMQFTSSWRGFIIGSLIADAVFSFIISPIYAALGIKQYHYFNYFYMFILVFAVTLIIKVIYNWISSIERKKMNVMGK